MIRKKLGLAEAYSLIANTLKGFGKEQSGLFYI